MAQTITTGALQDAVKLHNDTDLLREIARKDCVAFEARYHKKCYIQYTKILTRKIKPIGATVYMTMHLTFFLLTLFEKELLVTGKYFFSAICWWNLLRMSKN